MRLENKVALITGAGQGVGQGIALAMASEGAKVAVLGRTLSKLEDTCRLIEERGTEALPIVCDIKKRQELKESVDKTVDHFRTIDILVNNAQEVPLGELQYVGDTDFENGFMSGPMAVMRRMKLCRPHLKDGGNIINLATTAAKRWDAKGFGAYAAVKESIRALTRAAACEWAEEGIRANTILPHATSPGLKMWMKLYPEESAEFVDSIPMKRVGDCEVDIGRFVVALCTEDCRYVTGQSIAIDGGQAFMG